MEVKVKALGNINACTKLKSVHHLKIELEKGATLKNLIEVIKIPSKNIPYYNFLINGKQAYKKDILKDGDEITIFPAVGGG